jgi:hypothetical protein
MAALYVGTTAASSIANPPYQLLDTLSGQGNRPAPGSALWGYCSTNTSTEVTTANFFTDGQALGMSAGDIIFVNYCTSLGSTSIIPYMGTIGAVSTNGATLHTLTS